MYLFRAGEGHANAWVCLSVSCLPGEEKCKARSGQVRFGHRKGRSGVAGGECRGEVGQEEGDDETGKLAAVGCAYACACALYVRTWTYKCVRACEQACENARERGRVGHGWAGGRAGWDGLQGTDGDAQRSERETDRRSCSLVTRTITHRPVAATYLGTLRLCL